MCVDCGVQATDVDHDPPHMGDMAAFWDTSTWFSRCHSCHSKRTTGRDGYGFKPMTKRRVGAVRAGTVVNAW